MSSLCYLYFYMLRMFTLLLSNGALVLDLCHLQLALLVFEYARVLHLQGYKVSGMH